MQESMHPELSGLTTLRLGGTALAMLTVESEADLQAVRPTAAGLGGNVAVLGRGSNILAADGKLPLLLVRSGFKQEPELIEKNADGILVRVGSAVMLPGFLGRMAGLGYTGLEGLAGIPGTIGGALAMNAGSFGVTFGECLVSARIFTPDSGIVTVQAKDMRLGYREFSVPGLTDSGQDNWYMALDCTLRLQASGRSACREKLAEIYQRKKSGQPLLVASAGCVFKNPAGDSAGRLLEAAGMKGVHEGHMSFSSKHANFMVNDKPGFARTQDALNLIKKGADAVKAQFGIELETEIAIWA